MKLSLPDPDLAGLFEERLRRLLERLAEYLADDQDFVLAVPSSTPEAEEQGLRALQQERMRRPRIAALPFIEPIPAALLPPESEPMTVRRAIQLVDDELPRLSLTMAAQVRAAIQLFVDARLRSAVAARTGILVNRWPRPRWDLGGAAMALHGLSVLGYPALPEGEQIPDRYAEVVPDGSAVLVWTSWPPEAALLDVARWSRKARNGLSSDRREGDRVVEQAERGYLPADLAHGDVVIPAAGSAYVYLAEQDVLRGMQRPAMAVDSNKTHHEMVGAWRDVPQDGRRHRAAAQTVTSSQDDGIIRVELLAPPRPGETRAMQLQLPLSELEGMQDSAIVALRKLRGAEGLRNWAALLRLFSVEGNRSGVYRWLLDEHLLAMGYDERRRRDPGVRANAAEMVEYLSAIELAIYGSGGILRERRRLLLETGRFERLEESRWKLDGIEFQMNQRVFGGVRATTGEIGQKWMPAPVELAQIDHIRFPYAHALGMLLAIRFRWRLDEHADVLPLSGRKLLDLAGIPFTERRAVRAWASLRKTLDELRRVGQLHAYTWVPEEHAWTLGGICHLHSSPWITDRAARGLLPEESPVDRDRPVTGAELRAWRERKGWTQRQAAKSLRVTQGAISQAESKGTEPLGHKLRAAFLPFLDPRAEAAANTTTGTGSVIEI
jgi:DNA-binding XRE family transcriptional regulator